MSFLTIISTTLIVLTSSIATTVVANSCTNTSSIVLLRGNSTILSSNKTFELGFFNINKNVNKWYLGIWYASIPTPTYVWVANRQTPVGDISTAAVELTAEGKLVVLATECDYNSVVWEVNTTRNATEVRVLEEGNLVVLDGIGNILWQSFDFPTDTWLPAMNLSSGQKLTCWRSAEDPAEGRYSLRLRPPDFGEVELVFEGREMYWSSGNWTGSAFSGVPEMTVQYIYRFHFMDPFTPTASFGYTETDVEDGVRSPLTRFHLDSSGQLKQYTWSPQTEYWNMFWSQPENMCDVYGLCGNLGFCNCRMLNPCKCLDGFEPTDGVAWDSGDFSSGCRQKSNVVCSAKDRFEAIGTVSFDGDIVYSSPGSKSECESKCLANCSCIGLFHNPTTNMCKNLYGSLLNLQNLTSGTTSDDTLYLRAQSGELEKKSRENMVLLIVVICGCVAISTMLVAILLIWRNRRLRREEEEGESVFPVMNLKVFSYKELQTATNGFSEQLGHGGFGVVFRGILSDSSLVAVKRLERPGGGEREFRAEVCTVGNIQHVNLVRLRGFCSENLQRLLVYDYMPNGPLSTYLKRDGPNLNWEARYRIALGTARGITYLHEECRSCILHCDIKPENILLDEEFSAKLSDFGLAKLMGRDFSRVLATMRGTWGYVAPEWISGVAITTKADVYSYGMTLLELLGGRRNVEGPPSVGGGASGGDNEKWFFPPWAAREIIEGNVEAVVDERLEGNYIIEEVKRVGFVAVWCIQDEEGMRPTMGKVVKMLEGVVEVAVPPSPKLLQALVSGESFRGVGPDSANRVDGGGSHLDDQSAELPVNLRNSL